jgi:hypothetical protein
MKILSAVGAMLLLSVAALAGDKPRGTQLKNADLTQTFVSGTITIGDWSVLGFSDARLYLRGGIVHAVYSDPDGNGNYLQGSWHIDQDALCITWQSLGGGCGTIYKLADGSYETWVEGKRFYAFRVKPPPTATALKPPG